VVQTLSPNGANEGLDEWILPRALGRREDLLDAQALHAVPEGLTEDLVAITQQVPGGGSSGKASTICCAVHSAVGCSVMLKRTTRRR
jgi:hypothetical protein